MADKEKYTEKVETKIEKKADRWGIPEEDESGEYKKETTVKTEGTIKKEQS